MSKSKLSLFLKYKKYILFHTELCFRHNEQLDQVDKLMQKHGGAVAMYELTVEELRSKYLRKGITFPYIIIPDRLGQQDTYMFYMRGYNSLLCFQASNAKAWNVLSEVWPQGCLLWQDDFSDEGLRNIWLPSPACSAFHEDEGACWVQGGEACPRALLHSQFHLLWWLGFGICSCYCWSFFQKRPVLVRQSLNLLYNFLWKNNFPCQRMNLESK